jgi:hypothetical protein
MAGEIFAGLSAFKTMFDMAKALQGMHDTVARDRTAIDLQKEILSAYAEQSALMEQKGNLEKEVARLKAWDADKERYKLSEVRPGATAYALKEGMESGEPKHYLCASCYQSGHKSILQSETWNPGRCNVLVCHDCGWYVYVSGMSDPEHKSQKPKPYRGS